MTLCHTVRGVDKVHLHFLRTEFPDKKTGIEIDFYHRENTSMALNKMRHFFFRNHFEIKFVAHSSIIIFEPKNSNFCDSDVLFTNNFCHPLKNYNKKIKKENVYRLESIPCASFCFNSIYQLSIN